MIKEMVLRCLLCTPLNLSTPTRRNFKTREIIHKPACVVDCNYSMGAVDKSDVESTRKTMERYKKVFVRRSDVFGIHVACINSKTKKDTLIADFYLTLTRQILQKCRRDNFVKIITESLDKNPLGLLGIFLRFVPVVVFEETQRENALSPKMIDDEKFAKVCVVKFAT